MEMIVFAGPTLSAAEVRAEIDAVVLPPVSQGDVHRAALEGPWGIGIVDGYFESVPAVWHKEILWAMSQGVHVFGAASMGALRAAELATYGMVGVGAVFEAFRAGALTDDDEVAIVHGPAEEGYRPLSDALVSIRATLGRARAEAVIDAAAHDAWLAAAKRTFYPHRSFAALLDEAGALGIAAGAADRLRAWLPSGKLDVKRADALAMLRAMRAAREASPEPKVVRFHFEHTDLWEQVGRRAGRHRTASSSAGAAVQEDLLLDELRLHGPGALVELRTAALARALAAEEARRLGISASDEEAARLARELLAERRVGADGLDAWLEALELSPPGLARMLRSEVDLRRVRALLDTEIARALRDELRVRGAYEGLAARAADKQRVLAAAGAESPSVADAGEGEEQLVAAHFARRGEPVPADLGRYAAHLGLPDAAALVSLLLRERWYARLAPGGGQPVASIPASRSTRVA